MSNGWKYRKGLGTVWMPDTATARAQFANEYDALNEPESSRLESEMDDLEDAVRRDWAETLRKLAEGQHDHASGSAECTGCGIAEAALLIDPDTHDGGTPGHGLMRGYGQDDQD